MDINEVMITNGIRAKDIVDIVKQVYPKYDKSLQSKVERPDAYGIKLLGSAEKLVMDTLATKPHAPRRADKHRLSHSARCRISKTKLGRLQQAFKRDGYDTVQSGMTWLIDNYLLRRKEQ